MAGYCTVAQVKLACNLNEIVDLADDDGDGTADTGVIEWAITTASDWIWSIVRTQYASDTDMDPTSYTAATYPVLDYMTAQLAVEVLRARQGRRPISPEHHALVWASKVAAGLAEIAA